MEEIRFPCTSISLHCFFNLSNWGTSTGGDGRRRRRRRREEEGDGLEFKYSTMRMSCDTLSFQSDK